MITTINEFKSYLLLEKISSIEKEALKFWSNGGHDIIRALINGQEKIIDHYKKFQKTFDTNYYKEGPKLLPYFQSALSKIDNYEGIAYRGMRLEKGYVFEDYKKGDLVEFEDYASASKNEKIATHFAMANITDKTNSNGLLFKMFTKTAKDIYTFADAKFKKQEEIVILKGTNFIVSDIIKPISKISDTYGQGWLNPTIVVLKEI